MPNEEPNKPIYVSRSEVGKLFAGLNKKTLANLLSAGRGPKAFKIGRKIFYKVSDIEDWLTRCPIMTADQGGASWQVWTHWSVNQNILPKNCLGRLKTQSTRNSGIATLVKTRNWSHMLAALADFVTAVLLNNAEIDLSEISGIVAKLTGYFKTVDQEGDAK